MQLLVATTLRPLVPALVDRLRVPLASPFDVEHVVVPGSPMRTWLAATLADALGVWCNHAVYPPAELRARLGGPGHEPVSTWAVRESIVRHLGSPAFAGPRRYLRDDETGVRSVQLAGRVAMLFGRYARHRPALVAGWSAGAEPEDWQAIVWRDVATARNPGPTLPPRLTVFAVDHLAAAELAALREAAANADVGVFALADSPLAVQLGAEFPPRLVLGSESNTLLGRLQRGLGANTTDESFRVHVAHGPMREVEILRDQLLTRFGADPTLQPEDVLVLAPDMNDYAPLLEGVFASEVDVARAAGARARLPLGFADRSPLVEAPGLAAMALLLALPHSRRPLSTIAELFSLPPVYARFGLDEESASAARDWLDAAAVRWGEDAAFRVGHDNPELPEHTWRWGLDRLLLGHAVSGHDDRIVGGLVPVEGIEGNGARPLGGLCEFVGTLFDHLHRLEAVCPPTEWAVRLCAAFDALISAEGVHAPSRRVLVGALNELKGVAPIAIGGVADWLSERLRLGTSETRFFVGGVTCASLRAGRVVPARVVAILGLDDGRFPHDPTPLAFDRLAAAPEPGELGSRAEDRLVFRAAMLAAGDHLHLSYVGRGNQDNKPRPPSVLVAELLDLLPREAVAAVTVTHPMWSFSPDAFREPRARSYGKSLYRGAQALLQPLRPPPTFFPLPLPPPREAPTLDLAVLVAFFKNPAAALLRARLDLVWEEEAAAAGDREPLELVGLERWAVGDRLLRGLLAGKTAESLWPRLQGSGALPMGTPGRAAFEGLLEGASAIVDAAAGCGAGAPAPSVDLDLALPAGRLTGRLDDRRAQGALTVTWSVPGASHRLGAWIRHLAAQVAGVEGGTSWLVGRGPEGSARASSLGLVPDAERHLDALVALYAEGMRLPLPFAPRASEAYAVAYLKASAAGADEVAAQLRGVGAARAAWNPGSFAGVPGEGEQPAVARVFDASVLSTSEFGELALRVWAPCLDALAAQEDEE